MLSLIQRVLLEKDMRLSESYYRVAPEDRARRDLLGYLDGILTVAEKVVSDSAGRNAGSDKDG